MESVMETTRKRIVSLIALGALFGLFHHVQGENVSASFSEEDMNVVVGETSHVTLSISDKLNHTATLYFLYGDDGDKDTSNYVKVISDINIKANSSDLSWIVNVTGENAGHIVLGINSSSQEFKNLDDTFVRLDIVHNSALVIINAIIGWVYFAAWSVSFYPQVYTNWKRKSVVGLSFDFLMYNLTGFLAYGFFNVGMFWVDIIKDEYMSHHKHGINPVQLNDVIFSLHAVLITLITIFQCFIYDRGGQRPSKIAVILVSGAWLFASITLFVTIAHKVSWLTYLYYFSYIKLAVTLIKYIPQAVMNFRRKSTDGWSIGNILLDFTGGSLSLLQMFLLAYNSDDWESIFGDLTKFGLGAFSVLFDILFIVQHYCLYRGNSPYTSLEVEQEVHVNTEKSLDQLY